MTDIDRARKEWRGWQKRRTEDAPQTIYYAEALIAALEAENEALKAENERIRDLAWEYAPHLVIPKRRQP